MKRYFEVIGRSQSLMLDLTPPATTASVEELSNMLKMELRELTKKEYNQLTEKLTNDDRHLIQREDAYAALERE